MHRITPELSEVRWKMNRVGDLKKLWESIKDRIEARISEFDYMAAKAENVELFRELVFCLLTPQSKARQCAQACQRLFQQPHIFKEPSERIAEVIHDIRFKNNKAKYIKRAYEMFQGIDLRKLITGFETIFDARNWFAENVKGFGYKEASHFLRNTGFGYELAILDRHILKNLHQYGVIDRVPVSLSKKRYLEIESKMQDFSRKVEIPMHHLDFVFWYKQTGDIFK